MPISRFTTSTVIEEKCPDSESWPQRGTAGLILCTPYIVIRSGTSHSPRLQYLGNHLESIGGTVPWRPTGQIPKICLFSRGSSDAVAMQFTQSLESSQNQDRATLGPTLPS